MDGKQEKMNTYINIPKDVSAMEPLNENKEDDVKLETQNNSQGAEKTAKSDMLGFVFGMLGSLGVTMSAGCLQALEGKIPHFELLLFRYLGPFIILAAFFTCKRQVPRIKRKEIIYVAGWLVLLCMYVMHTCH